MSERIPCPACGSENGPEAQGCHVCDYRLDVETRDSGKCARCGSGLGSGFEFCQICGLRVQSRRRRPVTQSLRLVQRPRSEVGVITPTSTPALPPEALHAGAAARNAGPTTGEAPHAGAAAVKNAASPTGEAPRREVDEGAPQVTSQGPGGHVHGAATGPMPGFPARQVGVPAQ